MIYTALSVVALAVVSPPESDQAMTLKAHTDWVFCVSYSPDGATLVSCSADQHLIAWDTEIGKKKSYLKHTGFVKCAAFSPDGKYIAAGGEQNCLMIIDSGTFKIQRTLNGFEDSVDKIAFDRVGGILVAACDGRACIFETGNYRKLRTIDTEGSLTAISLSPDGKRLFYDGIWRLGVMEISTGKPVLPNPDYRDTVFSLAVSENGRLLAIGAQ